MTKPNILQRWFRYKYSGLITVPLTIGVILIAWYGYMDTLEFYDAFSCDGLVAYKINDESLDGNPTYNQMNHANQTHYDAILEDCKIDGRWYYNGQPANLKQNDILSNRITP